VTEEVIELNLDWRVVRDEASNRYVLEQREGDTWVARATAGYRNQLLRRIGDYCGTIPEDALKRIRMLPWRPEDHDEAENEGK
jgi:hypothetical protein